MNPETRPGKPFRTVSLPVQFAILVLVACPGAPAGDDTVFHPLIAGPKCVKGEPLLDVSRAEVAGVRVAVRPLDVREWETRLEKTAAGMGSALRPRDGSEPPFQVFLVSLDNRSPSRVQFQPGNVVRILDNLKFQDHPQDYTDFYRFLSHEEKDLESLESIKAAFFDSALTLEPGNSAERLLFFKPPPEKGWKMLTILISHFQVGTETHATSVPFHRGKKR